MASPVRTDEQIVPRNRWVPIGKSNCYLDEEKSQRNPIFKIAVDILKQTNFFRAFTASSTIPAIYIQQFWDTIRFDRKAGSFKCQLDEQWFNLNQDTLRDALQITPVDNNRAFSSPPTPDTLIFFWEFYTMTDVVHAPAMAPPVRTDEQILPRIRWDTICFDSKAGSYKCQLDEQWFNLTQDTLRDAPQITPVNKNHAFSPPPTPDTLIEFVNELGYPREVINLSNVTTNDMFQPWRALTTIINLMWEEFTQSIHNFTEDKRNLAQQAQGKKKATIILIPRIWFTKLIIFHLQRLYNFHPRPESPLHLPNEEPVLGNLKFSAKGTKQEVFGMTIPNELINDVIQGADYYDAYLKKVAKHQRYLAGEEVSDPDSPAPKPAKPTKQTKPKPTKQSKPTEPKAASKKPKPAPAKPQEKKRKPVSESSEAPPLAKRAKAGKVVKKRTVKSSKQLVDEFIDEGVPAAKPRLEDTEEAILQKVLEDSLTDAYPTQRGYLPHVVFRETDTRKLQPLPEVPGKGKKKVGEEQAAQVLLHLQTTKKKSLTEYDTESDEEMPSAVRSGAQDEGQAGPNPSKLDEGQAGPNPDDVAESQPLPTPSVLAGPNLEHSDVEITDPSSQPQPEHMDEGFTAAAYPDVQENLKLTVDEQVIQEEPVSSTGRCLLTTSRQRLCFGDQILEWAKQNQALETRLDKQGSRINKLETMDLPKMIRERIGGCLFDNRISYVCMEGNSAFPRTLLEENLTSGP
ncbi:hypothetical protein Tco_0679612 [Tanacetum coccineum]|uniref:Monodehydroascorbate reductase n=1 Tax=Tanacetum coccineum TaxID=301880 RepID=A0ABQ4XJB8_9ASTR